MPHLDHKRIHAESPHDVAEPLTGFFAAFEAPWELEQHSAQLAGVHHDIETLAHLIHFAPRPRFVPLVGEALPELGGEAELPVILHPVYPRGRRPGYGRSVKSGVDLDGVEEVRDVAQRVKAFAFF